MTSAMPVVDGMAFDTMAQFSAVAGDLRDPYPALAEKRRNRPVDKATFASFIDDLEETSYIVHRYDDVVAVLRDNVTFSSSAIRELMAPVMGDYVLVYEGGSMPETPEAQKGAMDAWTAWFTDNGLPTAWATNNDAMVR